MTLGLLVNGNLLADLFNEELVEMGIKEKNSLSNLLPFTKETAREAMKLSFKAIESSMSTNNSGWYHGNTNPPINSIFEIPNKLDPFLRGKILIGGEEEVEIDLWAVKPENYHKKDFFYHNYKIHIEKIRVVKEFDTSNFSKKVKAMGIPYSTKIRI